MPSSLTLRIENSYSRYFYANFRASLSTVKHHAPSPHACIRKTSIFIFMESMVVSDEEIAEIVVVIIIIINIAAMKVKVKVG